jgi:glycine cleavage system H protein
MNEVGIDQAGAVLKALADPNRLRIFNSLMQSDSCNCELGERLGLSRTLLSHHLNVLREAGLLRSRPDAVDGRWIYYYVDRAAAARWRAWFDTLLDPSRIQQRTVYCGPEGRLNGSCAPGTPSQPDIALAGRATISKQRIASMSEFLTTTVDKFTFKVAADRLYTQDHLWVKPEGNLLRIGVTDFLQQTAGDAAFVEVTAAPGASLKRGDELGSLETIKVTLVLASPVSGVVRQANAMLADAPEAVNQDPYEQGWLALVEADDWNAEQANLMDAPAYLRLVRASAEQEMKKR